MEFGAKPQTPKTKTLRVLVPLARFRVWAKDEVAFFQAVKARLSKCGGPGAEKTGMETETVIRQIVDRALVAEEVIDIFDAAGIKKPDISILSEEFLLEVKNMKHRHIAMEALAAETVLQQAELIADELTG